MSQESVLPLDYALELAFAAQRINGGYVKEPSELATFSFNPTNSVGAFAAKPKKPAPKLELTPNKHLVRETANWVLYDTAPSICKGNKHFPLVVTEEDKKNVEHAKTSYFKKLIFLVLNDNETDFNKKIYSLCLADNVRINDLGFISYIPEFLSKNSEEKVLKEYLLAKYKNSIHAASDVLTMDIEILKRKFINKTQCYVYMCGDDTNLYSFFNTKKYNVGDKFNITARVKNRNVENISKLPITEINYVKMK